MENTSPNKKFDELCLDKGYDLNLLEISEKLKENKSDIPILYRYSPGDYNNIRNLETKTIFLSEVGSMNDVFEGLSSEVETEFNGLLEYLGKLVSLKSFSEKSNDLKMWSQYADSYAGMCVAYDLTGINDDLIYHLFPITYSNTRRGNKKLTCTLRCLEKKLKNEDCDDFFLQDIISLFLVKPKCWENEKEWRIIFSWLQLNKSADEIICDKEEEILYKYDENIIDFPYAKEIYLGPKMPKNKKQHISDIGKKLNIPVYEMVLSQTEYKLEEKIYLSD